MTTSSAEQKLDQQYTFDDIELYAHVVLKGDHGWVLDKGDHVAPEIKHWRHLYIEFNDNDRDSTNLNEKLVNKYLREKEVLWVDFDNMLFPFGNY